MSLTQEEKDRAKSIIVTDRGDENIPKKVKKHITSINAPAFLHETIGGKCLVEVCSTENLMWVPESDVTS